MLFSFLDSVKYQPEVIIFIDDAESSLVSVEDSTKNRNDENTSGENPIEFIGLRYGGCDEQVKAFSKEQAGQELTEFLEQYPME